MASSSRFDKFNSSADEGRNKGSGVADSGDATNGVRGDEKLVSFDDLRKLTKEASDLEARLNELKGFVGQLEQAKLESRLDDLEDKVRDTMPNVISVFAVFTAVITFFSMEVQFLRNICNPLMFVGMSMILASSLFFFAYIIIFFFGKGEVPISVNDNKIHGDASRGEVWLFQLDGLFFKKRPSHIILMVVILFFLGIVITFVSAWAKWDACTGYGELIERLSKIEGKIGL